MHYKLRELLLFSIILIPQLLLAARPADSVSVKRPNVVVVFTGDLGYGDLGVYGQTKIETPNIDRLAAQGMRFTNFYSGSSTFAPSQCVLLTGKHAGKAAIRGTDEWAERGSVMNYVKVLEDSTLEGQRPLPRGEETIASLLKREGYATGAVGLWGLGSAISEGSAVAHGFDTFYGYSCLRQAQTYYPKYLWRDRRKVSMDNALVFPNLKLPASADPYKEETYSTYTLDHYAPDSLLHAALRFVDANRAKPFFLFYAAQLPLEPLQAPQNWVRRYRLKLGEEEPYLGLKGGYPNRTPRATYAAMVSYLDEQVGKLVEKLKADGVFDNTIIIFTSANGASATAGVDGAFFESAGPYPLGKGRGKGSLFESGIKVPFFVVWPGVVAPNQASDLLSIGYDMVPTIAEMVGAPKPADADGISLLPTLKGNQLQEQHEYLYWEDTDLLGHVAIREGRWKLIGRNMSYDEPYFELYDLLVDPAESTDVGDQNPNVAFRLVDMLLKARTSPNLPCFRIKYFED
jgi:arylsulfatase A-like enzyme